MEDSVWIFLALSVVISIANALDRPIWSPECPSNASPSGDTLFPHPGDCGKFYKCLDGLAYPIACPVGLHWSQSLSKCYHPHVVNCQVVQPRTVQFEYNPMCPLDENPSNPTHLPNDIDCGQFYKCLGGNAYAMTCPGGQHWSKELNRCEDPSVANCQRKEIRTLSASGDINADCPLDDDPNNPTLLAHSADCGKFLKCSYGRSYILSCPYGLHWDVKTHRCESPFVAKCKSGTPSITEAPPITSPPIGPPTKPTTNPTPPTAAPTTSPTPPTAGPDPNLPVAMPECSDPTSVQKFTIPGECKAFLQCYNGLAFRIKCREGREWSVIANDCIDAALAGCSTTTGAGGTTKRTTAATARPPTTPRPTTKVPTLCAEGVEFLSHPTDCTKYIQCDNGNQIVRDCAPGTYWSKTLRNCQWTPSDCR